MKLDVRLIKDLYDTLAFDEAPSGDDKTDADVYRKHRKRAGSKTEIRGKKLVQIEKVLKGDL